MTDEKYVFIKDSAEKKRNARGYYQKNRTGKGRVRFPDDNLTRKEKAGLSKDLGTYKMGEPVYWKEFRTWPAEFQKEYFEKLDERFNVGSPKIAKMMGCGQTTIAELRKKLGCNRSVDAKKPTLAEINEFEHWIRTFRGVDISETPYETKKVVEKPSQIEKFEARYKKGDSNEPPENKLATEYTAPTPKPRLDIVDPMELMFRAYNVDDNFEDIVERLRGALMIFRQCHEVQIEIKAPARKNPPPAGKDSGRELNDKGQPRIVGFGE